MCGKCATRLMWNTARARIDAMPWWKRAALFAFYRSRFGRWWHRRQMDKIEREFERISGVSLREFRDLGEQLRRMGRVD